MENSIPQHMAEIVVNGMKCFPGGEEKIGYYEKKKEIGKRESKVF
jgi:hypothetical protein